MNSLIYARIFRPIKRSLITKWHFITKYKYNTE